MSKNQDETKDQESRGEKKPVDFFGYTTGNDCLYSNFSIVDNNVSDISIRFFQLGPHETHDIFGSRDLDDKRPEIEGVDPSATILVSHTAAMGLLEALGSAIVRAADDGLLPPIVDVNPRLFGVWKLIEGYFERVLDREEERVDVSTDSEGVGESEPDVGTDGDA